MPEQHECQDMHRRITDAEGHISRFNNEIDLLNKEQHALVKSQAISVAVTEKAMVSMDKLARSIQPLVDAHTTFRGVKSFALWVTALVGCGSIVYSVFFQ